MFYVALDGQLISVPITLQGDGKAIRVGTASALFPVRLAGDITPGSNRQQYAVSSDGLRFLANVTTEEQSAPPITLIFHWKPPL